MSFLKNLKPNKPTASLEGYFISMLAKSKFGKTTFAIDLAKEFYGTLDSTLLLATEIGYKTMNGVYAIPVTGFEYAEDETDKEQKGFMEVVDELIENKKDIPFRFIIIDTITALERYAIAHTIRKANFQDQPETRYADITDIPWGKGYNMVAEFIYSEIDRLKKAGFGVFIIGHEKSQKVKNKDGFEYDYTTFNVLGKTSNIIEREADMIIYGDLLVEKGKDGKPVESRVLRFRSDGNILCGTRFRNFPATIDNEPKKFLDAFKEAVLSLYDNDEKAVEVAVQEEEQKTEEKADRAIEKANNSPEKLKEKISEIIDGFERSTKKTLVPKFKELLGNPDYKLCDDSELLKQVLDIVKNV
ncbi:AAA family ATPase [Halobacillus rhizosphaerae]|uniref:AAA family ATPase n=1 Tax=Halobacillus rhizosphaerae TaxID=3064889 RepID=UPI00398BBC6D